MIIELKSSILCFVSKLWKADLYQNNFTSFSCLQQYPVGDHVLEVFPDNMIFLVIDYKAHFMDLKKRFLVDWLIQSTW